MIYKSVAEIYEAIDQTRAQLVARAESLTEDELSRRANDEGWTPANVLEHLAKTEAGLVPLFHKLLKQAEAAGGASDGNLNPPVSFAAHTAKVAVKMEAPERIRPEGAASIAESLEKLRETRGALQTLRPRIEAVDASGTEFPHPFLGKLNLYEWLAFVGLHEARHLRQIENILSAVPEA